MASINDFDFLNNSTHRQIYSTIREALKYYLIDPKKGLYYSTNSGRTWMRR